MKKIGLVVNPIAGMGGSVGLKGTDGNIVNDAIELGAKPITPERIQTVLRNIKRKEEIIFIVAPGVMGENYINEQEYNFKVIGEIGEITTAEDTKRIAKKMLEKEVDLIIFCGGDGTARDLYDAIDLKIPVIGVPAGVKMFSSVFALNPYTAAEIVDLFIDGVAIQEQEVLDINEDSFRNDILDSKLYGYLKVPKLEKYLQDAKKGSVKSKTSQNIKENIALFIIENMERNSIYFLGPGTTVKAITDKLGLKKTLLGIDAIYNSQLIGTDLNEKQILQLIEKYDKSIIIVSPIGGQGFIFGRGNKQFTPKVIKKVGRENIIIIATEDKIKGLKSLKVDTGDLKIDNLLKGYFKVIIDSNEKLLIEIE